MANFKKSFNFRNGLQVEDDDFIVRGSRVGIGTTVPDESFDVRGTAQFVGLLTAKDFFSAGVSTFADLRVGTGITMNASGVITATAFYGNGATLLNLPTSQWQDVDVGLGFTSIYAVGNVGIATRDPRFVLQIGRANLWQQGLAGESGIGINSQGGVISSGIITAYSFVGFGSFLQLIDADNIDLGTLSNDRLPIINNDRLPQNINISGIITAQNRFSGILYGDVVGIATTARGLTGTPDISVGVVTSKNVNSELVLISGNINSGLGIATANNAFHVGSGGTAFIARRDSKVGIGTDILNSELQITRRGTSTIEVISLEDDARISLGSSFGITGDLGGTLFYAPTFNEFRGDLKLANRSRGNLQFILHSGSSPGVSTGSFNWINGNTASQLMSLTSNGNLGIGKTDPTTKLYCNGSSYFNGYSQFIGEVNVSSVITVNTVRIGDPNAILNQNISVNSGVSTLSNLVLNGGNIGFGQTSEFGIDARDEIALINSIGVGQSYIPNNTAFFVSGVSLFGDSVGIGTTSIYVDPDENNESGTLQLYNGSIRLENSSIYLNGVDGAVGINSFLPVSSLDMRYARFGSVRGAFYPPNLTTSERNALSPTNIFDGALIFNTNIRQFQGFNGSSWNNFGGGGEVSYTAITASGINVSGVVTATSFTGSGANLTTLNATNLSSGTVSGLRGVTSGSTSSSFLRYNGTTQTSGAFDGSTTTPSATTRLNYNGNFHATNLLDGKGNVRTLPPNVQPGSYELVLGDVGKFVSGVFGITVPNGVFSAGDVVTLYNNSDISFTISRKTGAITFRLAGSSGSQISYSLAARGVAQLICVASDEFVAYGNGVS